MSENLENNFKISALNFQGESKLAIKKIDQESSINQLLLDIYILFFYIIFNL